MPLKAAKPDWTGKTVVCIASGPSLTAEDCETVRASGMKSIVTNTTFRLCPWADVLFGFDGKWWDEYKIEAKEVFGGRFVSADPNVSGVETTFGSNWFTGHGNSGTCAIYYALCAGAKKVVLIGYDTQRTNGSTHWHGDHPKKLSNARSIASWPNLFRNVAAEAKVRGAKVLNASRETALTCFDRVDLKSALS